MDFTAPRPDFAAVPRPAFGRQAAHVEAPPPHRGKAKAAARRLRMLREARDLLDALPQPGETLHAIQTGRFDLALLLTAILDLLPAPCRRLRVATLSYNKANAAELLGLLESGKAGGLTLLCSLFFRAHYKELHEWFAAELRAYPGSRLAAARSHCKVFLFDLADDSAIVIEGSGNLRCNGNREQLTVFNDRPLHDWHSNWIDQQVNSDEEAGR
jgi:hypothetical protein